MVQKKIHEREEKKEEKKIPSNTIKDKFVEEPLSPYTTFDRRGIKQSTGKIEFVKAGQKITMERGISSSSHRSREIISMDRSGRLVLPKKIRNHFATNRFEISMDNDKIELIPVKPLRSLLGSLSGLDIEKIYREHDQEADEEDEE